MSLRPKGGAGRPGGNFGWIRNGFGVDLEVVFDGFADAFVCNLSIALV